MSEVASVGAMQSRSTRAAGNGWQRRISCTVSSDHLCLHMPAVDGPVTMGTFGGASLCSLSAEGEKKERKEERTKKKGATINLQKCQVRKFGA